MGRDLNRFTERRYGRCCLVAMLSILSVAASPLRAGEQAAAEARETARPLPLEGSSLQEPDPAGAPPLSAFPAEVLRNLTGLLDTDNLVPLLIGAGATGLATPFDDDIQSYFGGARRLREFGNTGTVLGHPLTVGLVSGGLLMVSRRYDESSSFRRMSFSLAQGYVVGQIVTAGLKRAIPRTRPNGQPRSFPSGHSREAFTAATIVSHYYPRSTIPAYAIAGLIGVSRMEKNSHYLADVVAGAALGYIVGRTVLRNKNPEGPASGFRWTPTFSLGEGFDVAVVLEW